jgi:uncharacterized protein YndB with AHSA1/START domain
MKSDVKIGDNCLTITRVFDAPRQLVFEAWTHADQIQQWWGCAMTKKVETQIDFRVGGLFTNKMQIEGVGEFTYTATFDEIVEPERIAYHAEFGGMTSRVTVEFVALSGSQTKLILTQIGFPSKDLCPIVAEGTTAALDKLEQMLVGLAA